MKFNIVVKDVKVGNIAMGEIAVNTEYSVTEAVKLMNAGANIVLDVIKQAPEIMEKIGEAEVIEAEKAKEVKKVKWLDSLYEKPKKDKVDEVVKLVDEEW